MNEDPTIEAVGRQVEQLAGDRYHPDSDWENWHQTEDQLHHDVLRIIAAGHPDPAALAAEALRTLDIEGVTRWYA